MIDPTLVPLAALLGVAVRARLLARRGRRAGLLLRTLEGDRTDDPDVDTFDAAVAARLEPTSLHVNVRAGSLIAVDAGRATVHLASLRGRRLESARLPIAQIESIGVLENDAPLAEGRVSALVRSFRLRIALPDERRSLYDIELLERPCRRGSAPHLAARTVAASCGVAPGDLELGKRALEEHAPDGHALGDGALERGPADPDGTAPSAVRGVGTSVHAWSRRSKALHGALAASLVAAVVVLQTARFGSTGEDIAPVTAADAGPAGRAAPARELAPDHRARAFESTLDERERSARALLGPARDEGASGPGRADLERAIAAFEKASTLPLDDVHAARVERLRTALAEAHARELPRYRESFARNARRGARRVAAWTRGEDHRVLELIRHDFADPTARETLWNALAEDVRALGFERVEFRAFRTGEPLESVALANASGPSTASAGSGTGERVGAGAPLLAGAR